MGVCSLKEVTFGVSAIPSRNVFSTYHFLFPLIIKILQVVMNAFSVLSEGNKAENEM